MPTSITVGSRAGAATECRPSERLALAGHGPGKPRSAGAQTPQIMTDAAHAILTRPASEATGHTYIDEDVLRVADVTDFDAYRADPTSTEPLAVDLFLNGDRG